MQNTETYSFRSAMKATARSALKATSMSAVVLSAIVLVACAPRVDPRGNLPDPGRVAEFVPGEISKGEVLELIGSPSSVASFDGEIWYYISKKTETLAFLAPEVKERKVLVLKFNKKGMLTELKTLGLEDGKTLEPIERVTPTVGKEIGVFEQLLGNLGRFGGKE